MGLFKQIKNLNTAGQGASHGSDFDPIAGVSLELYTEITRHLTDADDLSQVVRLAEAKGISVANWDAAAEGWTARILANPEVGRQFSALYQRREPG
jgi:hypothetical protein